MPQAQLSVRVRDKERLFEGGALEKFSKSAAERAECVRVNVRPSGTEPVVRIMAEGGNCAQCVTEIARYLRDIQGVI